MSILATVSSLSSLMAVGFFDKVASLVHLIPKIIYFLIASLLSIVDLIQVMFRKLAGLDSYYVVGEAEAKNGDVIYDFLVGIIEGDYPILQTAFWSLIILGVIMLFVSTIIAIIKSELNPTDENARGEKITGNSKTKVFKGVWKAVFLLAIVPIACIFGVKLSNTFLQAIDSATSVATTGALLSDLKVGDNNLLEKNENGTFYNYNIMGITIASSQQPFSGYIFKVGAYNANRVRDDEDYYIEVIKQTSLDETKTTNFGIFDIPTSREECAEVIDECFAISAKISDNAQKNRKLDMSVYNMEKVCAHLATDPFSHDLNIKHETFSRFKVGMVWYYYNLWKFDFIAAFAGLYFMIKLLFDILFGLVKRLIMTIALFISYAPFIGVMPLYSSNDKSPYAGWKSSFIKNVIACFGAIGGLNVMMILLPFINTIKFFDPANTSFLLLNNAISCILVIAAIALISDFIKIIEGALGFDANKEGIEKIGSDLGKATGSLATKGTIFAGGVGLETAGAALGAAGAITNQIRKQNYNRNINRNENNARRKHNQERQDYNEDKKFTQSQKEADIEDKAYNSWQASEKEKGSTSVDRSDWDKLGADSKNSYINTERKNELMDDAFELYKTTNSKPDMKREEFDKTDFAKDTQKEYDSMSDRVLKNEYLNAQGSKYDDKNYAAFNSRQKAIDQAFDEAKLQIDTRYNKSKFGKVTSGVNKIAKGGMLKGANVIGNAVKDLAGGITYGKDWNMIKGFKEATKSNKDKKSEEK